MNTIRILCFGLFLSMTALLAAQGSCDFDLEFISIECDYVNEVVLLEVVVTGEPSPITTIWVANAQITAEELGDTISTFVGIDTNYVNVGGYDDNSGNWCSELFPFDQCNPGACQPLNLTYDTILGICGQSNGGLQIYYDVPGEYLFRIYSGDSLVLTTSETTIEALEAGEYTLEAICQEGIVGQLSFGVLTDSYFAAEITYVDTENCLDSLYGSPIGTQYVYEWDTGENTPNVAVSTDNLVYLRVTDTIIGCTDLTFILIDSDSLPISIGGGSEFEVFCGQTQQMIDPVVSGGVMPYSFEWSDGSSADTLANVGAGNYGLTVTDDNGCTAEMTYTVLDNALLGVTMADTATLCGVDTITLVAEFTPYDPNDTYQLVWTDATGTEVGSGTNLDVSTAGTYTFTVSNLTNDCSGTGTVQVGQEDFIPDYFLYFYQPCFDFCDSRILHRGVDPDGNEFTATSHYTYPDGFVLTDGNPGLGGTPPVIPGQYTATVVNPFNACDLINDTLFVIEEQILCARIRGTVFVDSITVCGTNLENAHLVSFQSLTFEDQETGELFYTVTNNVGYYNIEVPPGIYEITLGEFSGGLSTCGTETVDATSNVLAAEKDINLSSPTCPRVEVKLIAPMIRRCFDNYVSLEYRNTGQETAENVEIELQVEAFADEVSFPPGYPVGNVTTDPDTEITTVTWLVGALPPFSVNQLKIIIFTCNNDHLIGDAACMIATVTPNDPCPPADANWSGASVTVLGSCDEDGQEVVFEILNVGDGDMTTQLEYIVIEDGLVLNTVTDTGLVVGEIETVSFPANGATYHLQAFQEPLHPGLEMPIDFVEGCGPNPSQGFALQFPLSDDAPWVDEECLEIIGAYDPNDKRAMPRGYGPDRYIEAGQLIDYTIRFQNTGNDTAFLVVVRDEIAPELDLATFRFNSATHPVDVAVDEPSRLLAFSFPNIRLVDSLTNPAGSIGALSFSIRARADLAAGTSVENDAAIYFDYNDPIATNNYQLVVEEDFMLVSNVEFHPSQSAITVYPNPTGRFLRFDTFDPRIYGCRMEVFDALGRIRMSRQLPVADASLDVSFLNAGMYYFKLSTRGGEPLGKGSFVVR